MDARPAVRFGCCASMIAPARDPLGIDSIEILREAGYDYIELSLRDIAALDADAFGRLEERIGRAGLPSEAFNNLFPASFRLTGPEADLDAAEAYAARALARAGSLGGRVVVFGSGDARRVPEGFDHRRASGQLVELLRRLAPIAGRNGLTVVIEPLRRQESNIVNSVAEALALSEQADASEIQVLTDYYHLNAESEDAAVIARAGGRIRHAHLANPAGRRFPADTDGAEYDRFFGFLHQAGYGARLSVEAYTESLEAEAGASLAFLRSRTQMRLS